VSDPWYDRVMALLTRADLLGPVADPELAAELNAALPRPDSYALPDAKTADVEVPGPHGTVPVRVYSRGDGTGRPVVLLCHGGGWIGGDLEMPEADATARELVARADLVVVSVDYRLAVNGRHFPEPLDDVEAAYRWAVTEHGADRVVVAGCSAGANLTAGLVTRLRDVAGPLPRGTVLVYPLVHPQLPPLSEELAAKTACLSPLASFCPEVLDPLVENYLGGALAEAHPHAMPALADPSGLPPTLIINSEHDALRASGEAYAAQLSTAGVEVEVHCAPGVMHGHFNHPWLPATQEGLDQIRDFVERITAF